jgi:hypothetical protein
MFYVFWKGKIKEWRDTDKERKRPIERERETDKERERQIEKVEEKKLYDDVMKILLLDLQNGPTGFNRNRNVIPT